MLCYNCKKEKLDSDFINNCNVCYKCLYRIKIEKIKKNRTPKTYLCRTCGIKFLKKEKEKKRQRTIFCSFECAHKGHQEQLNNYWTRKIPS